MKLQIILLFGAILLIGCMELADIEVQKNPISSSPLTTKISDGSNNGNPHFYFLPPLVPMPTFSGKFDGELEPNVQICELLNGIVTLPGIAMFSMSTGPGSETIRVNTIDELYIVNWHTKRFNLDEGKTYRITVRVGQVQLGYVDVIITGKKDSLGDADPEEFISVKNGRTLPIKFRIEEGALIPPDFTWSFGAPMPTTRNAGATAIIGDVIYTFGGHEGNPGTCRIVEAYNTITDSWETKTSYPRGEGRYQQGVAVIGTEVYFFGGVNCWGSAKRNQVDKYDTDLDQWTLDVSFYPLPTICNEMCVTFGNKVYCFGGWSKQVVINHTYEFSPSTGLFVRKADMPTAREGGYAIAIQDKILVMGGNGELGYCKDVEVYYPASDTWGAASPMPIALAQFFAGIINGKVYVASGQTTTIRTNRVFEYDPVNDTWKEKKSFTYNRDNAFGGTVNGKLFVIAGYGLSTFVKATEIGVLE